VGTESRVVANGRDGVKSGGVVKKVVVFETE
jgi:hypothetical protein